MVAPARLAGLVPKPINFQLSKDTWRGEMLKSQKETGDKVIYYNYCHSIPATLSEFVPHTNNYYNLLHKWKNEIYSKYMLYCTHKWYGIGR